MEMVTPRPSSRLPQLLCCSFSFLPISSLRSCQGGVERVWGLRLSEGGG